MKIAIAERRAVRIEMLPLIDIVFLLLVVFIYAMLSMAVHRGLPVELPTSAGAAPEKDLVLSVTVRAGQNKEKAEVFLDGEVVRVEELGVLLRQKSAGQGSGAAAEPGVLLFADRSIDFQQLFRVLDQINRAGLSRVSLQADVE